MPFIQPALLAAEYGLLEHGNWDVVIPRLEEGLEPLHAVYRTDRCLPPIRLALAEDRLKMISWFKEVSIREMELEEIRAFDPGLQSFKNINTPDEFGQAETK
jgi:molybdopterin-guanine dinucleotide biosynthesis protein A